MVEICLRNRSTLREAIRVVIGVGAPKIIMWFSNEPEKLGIEMPHYKKSGNEETKLER